MKLHIIIDAAEIIVKDSGDKIAKGINETDLELVDNSVDNTVDNTFGLSEINYSGFNIQRRKFSQERNSRRRKLLLCMLIFKENWKYNYNDIIIHRPNNVTLWTLFPMTGNVLTMKSHQVCSRMLLSKRSQWLNGINVTIK